MKKSTFFLSAAITAFILVIVAGVIFKARANADAAALASTLAPSPTSTATATDTLQPTNMATLQPTPVIITPQEAVFIASSALGDTKVYSVDTVNRYGIDVYQVNFSSGHIVFVSPEGHILTITMLQSASAPAATDQPAAGNSSPAPSNQPARGSDDGGGNGSGGDD